MSTPQHTTTASVHRRSDAAENRRAHIRRLAACLGTGFVLALMIGPQEGVRNDYGYAFRQAVFAPRILVFLLIGVLLYLAVTFWPRLTPYLRRPGVRPLTVGVISVVAANGTLKWSDNGQLESGRLKELAGLAKDTGALDPVTPSSFARSCRSSRFLVSSSEMFT